MIARMRVLVDARLLLSGGIGRYLRELAGHWLMDGSVEEVRLLGTRRDLERWLLDRPGERKARVVSWTDPVYSLRAQLRWARLGERWAEGCDVAFFPHWDAPAKASGPPRLVAVHDLTQFLEPAGFPLWKRLPGRLLLDRVVRTARVVVTVSEATRQDLEERFPDAGPRIRVIPNGVRHSAFRPLDGEERARSLERWESFRPFLLYVGPVKPHKGVSTALRAIETIARERPDLRLVQVGPPEIRDAEVRQLLRSPELRARFVQVGVLDDVRLNEAYGAADCLLHPARKEGFGLPPLEAMAGGVPVLASDRSSLPEVTGDAAVLLDPDDPEAWARAILTLLQDPERRADMARRGRERALGFSWARTAAETLELLREVARYEADPLNR
jgi:glycosyltransferase involved in cell wall biosynthesis